MFDTLASFLGPIFGVIIADFYFVQNKKINHKELFYPEETTLYIYNSGWNLKALYSVLIGFIFFYYTFNIIYSYAKNDTSYNLFMFLLIVWSLYGIAALFENNKKNICYNLLDIVSKNFYGLYIYYIIKNINNIQLL